MQALCELDELRPGAGKALAVETPSGPRQVALFRDGDIVHAYLNTCPHQGRNLDFAPGAFLITPDGRLVCPHHGASFEIATGLSVGGPCQGAYLTPFPVTVKEGRVFRTEG